MKYEDLEHNIENHEKYMTVYFSKATGKIVSTQTGLNNMDTYKKFDESLLVIWDYIIVPKDMLLLNKPELFAIIEDEVCFNASTNARFYKTI